jgi:hypothetical protein
MAMTFVALACAESTAVQPPCVLDSSLVTARVHVLRQTSVGDLTFTVRVKVKSSLNIDKKRKIEFKQARTGLQE